MPRKTKEKTLEVELFYDELADSWTIRCESGSKIPASMFEIILWKEIISLRGQVNYFRDRLNRTRDALALAEKECNEK